MSLQIEDSKIVNLYTINCKEHGKETDSINYHKIDTINFKIPLTRDKIH